MLVDVVDGPSDRPLDTMHLAPSMAADDCCCGSTRPTASTACA